MGHSHGKKRRKYSRIGGHLFAQERNEHVTPREQRSLCGLTLTEAAAGDVRECTNCEIAKDQLWA